MGLFQTMDEAKGKAHLSRVWMLLEKMTVSLSTNKNNSSVDYMNILTQIVRR